MQHSAAKLAGMLSRQPAQQGAKAAHDQYGTIRAVGQDDSVVYEVMLDGAEDYAPCTPMVAVHHGDRVLAHIVNHRIVVFANVTAPSVTEAEYTYVKDIAEAADDLLDGVAAAASTADKTVAEILTDAVTANGLVSGMKQAADTVETTLAQVVSDATSAASSASMAIDAANKATYALSEVEDVVGVANWIAEHSEYVSQYGGEFVDGKTYYTRSGSGTDADPYVYTQVAEPVAADIDSYYTRNLSESIQNYIASHVYLLDDGLYVADSASGYKARIGSGSFDVIAPDTTVVASFGQETFIGASGKPVCVKLTGDGMTFYPYQNGEVDEQNPIASFVIQDGAGKLVVHNAVIMQELQFGKWKWMPRANGNLALKWIG